MSDLATARPQPQALADPNPMLLYHVYTAILMSLAGALYRGVSGEFRSPDDPAPAGLNGDAPARTLAKQISFVSDLLQDHAALIQAANAADALMYPIGDQTLWLAPNQVERYVGLRDGVLNAAPRIIRECAGLWQLTVSPAMLPLVEKELKVIQAAARGAFANTFGEAAGILRTGFASALYVLDLLQRENDDNAQQRRLR